MSARGAVADATRNVVYAWPTWKRYYACEAVPEALEVRAHPRDAGARIVSCLPRSASRFLFHIDLTEPGRFPLDRAGLIAELEKRSIRVLNGRVTDLRKRTLHETTRRLGIPCAEAPSVGSPSDLLLVKTDRNYGGRSERLLGRRLRKLLGVRDAAPPIRHAFDYRLMRRNAVPRCCWTDPDLAVERFISNPEGRIYRVHVVLDHLVVWSGVSHLAVKKIPDCSGASEEFLRSGEFPANIPSALVQTVYRFIEGFSLDYGTLDVIGDTAGKYYIIDVNATPGYGVWGRRRIDFSRQAWTAADVS
jgi:hypothetical protein